MQYLIDYLGGAKYKKLILAQHPITHGAGFFSNVDGFGSALPVIEALAKKGCLLFRIHLCWKDNHKFTDKDILFVRSEAKKLKAIIKKYPNVKWYVSPCCEHELNEIKWNKFADVVNKQLEGTNYELVNTPNHNKGFVSKLVLNEYHGSEQKPRGGRYAFSFDGTSSVDSEVQKYKKSYCDAEYFALWEPRFNGRWEGKDITPRPQRKGWPDKRLIKSVLHLTRIHGQVLLPKKWLYKSHAENKGTGDARAEKPVFLIPLKTEEVVLKALNGQVIERLRYYGEYSDSRSRYYAKTWGYLIAQKAFKLTKDYRVQVWVNNKNYGVIDPAFRFEGK